MEEVAFEKGRKYAVKIEQTPARGPVLKFVWTRVIDDPLGRAVAAAKSADLVIAVAGISSALEGEEMPVNLPGFAGGDRTSLDMPKDEEDLLKAMKAIGQEAGGGADERLGPVGELGGQECRRHCRGLVSRRGRRHGHRPDAVGRQQSRRGICR